MSKADFAVRWGGSILSLLVLTAAGPARAIPTPAGTLLVSKAQALYTDAGAKTVESQPVSVTVAKKAAASVKLDQISGSVTGTTAYSCTLQNDSNYANGVRSTVTTSTNASAYLASDDNGDGVWQPKETNVVRTTASMPSAGSQRCFLLVRARPGTPDGTQGGVTVLASPADDPYNETSATFTAVFKTPRIRPSFTFAVGDALASSPTVRNGVALVGSESGVLYAVRAQGAQAGTLAWRFPKEGTLGAPIRGRVAADDSGYYFTANNGSIYKLSLAGELLWESPVAPAGTAMEAMPIVTDASVTLACGDGRVRRLDKASGAVTLMSPEVGSGTLTTPSMPRPGDLWVGGSDGYVYNMNDERGFTVLAAHSVSLRPVVATPFVDVRSGLVMCVGEEGNVYAMRIRSDEIVWGPKSLGSPVKGSPWVDSNAGIAYLTTTDGELHALNVKDGTPVPGYPVRLSATGGFENAPVALPLPAGQTAVFAGSNSGVFYSVNAADPGRVAIYDPGDPAAKFLGAPALSGPTADDVVVAAATNGTLYGFAVREALAP